MKAGKIWGQTELIHANGVLEFHRIEFKKGYKCSEHEHKFKWNGFFVESGKMIVRVWQEDQEGLVDETILKAGHHHGSTYYEHLELQKAITENLRAQVSLDDGLKAVAIGQAAELSIIEGRVVYMNEILED